MYERMFNGQGPARKKSRILMVVGGFFLFCAFAILGLIMAIAASNEGNGAVTGAIVAFFLYFLGGVFMINIGRKLEKSGERYRRYMNIVINQKQRAIEAVASQMGEDYAQTVKGL